MAATTVVDSGKLVLRSPDGRDEDAQLPYLGGGTVQEDFPCPIYKNFPRPVKLPPPSFKLKKSTCKEAKEAFLLLWDGNFDAEWMLTTEDSTLRLGVFVSVPDLDNNNKYCSGKKVARVTVESDNWWDEEVLQVSFSCDFKSFNAEFCANFSEEIHVLFAYRLMHQFLRSGGHVLMSNERGGRALAFAYKLLFDVYVQEFPLSMDVAIIGADLGINYKLRRNSFMLKLGELLEAQGKDLEAGEIYSLSANLFSPTSNPALWQEHARMKRCAALAFRNANKFDLAEECNICALHFQSRLLGEDFDVNERITNEVLCNMQGMYLYWPVAEPKYLRILPIFATVLFASKFKHESKESVNVIGRKYWTKLKKKYRTKPTEARNLLMRAASSPDVAHFHRVLNECVPERTSFQNELVGEAAPVIAVEAARERIHFDADRTPTFHCGWKDCSKSSTKKSDLECCPCKSISYCSAACQRKDWPEHRLVCPWQLKKKK